jgi:uncharacterized protein YegL
MSAMKFLLPLLVVLTLGLPVVHAQDSTNDALTREREEQTGTAITILFDNSGSMKGEKIKQAKAAFRSWLQTVPTEYKYSLITFEGNGQLVVPLGEKTRDIIAQRVAKLDANTSTPICGALRIAREQIEKRRREVTPYERHVVLIFTDGQETADPRGADGVRADIAALRKQTVEVVGVGFHGEGDYMNGVATRFALANNEQELKQGLAKVDAEIGGVDDLVVSADDLAALKKFQAPPVQPISATAVPEAAAEPAPPASTPAPKKRGLNMGWIIMAIIAWLLLRGFSKPKKTKR